MPHKPINLLLNSVHAGNESGQKVTEQCGLRACWTELGLHCLYCTVGKQLQLQQHLNNVGATPD